MATHEELAHRSRLAEAEALIKTLMPDAPQRVHILIHVETDLEEANLTQFDAENGQTFIAHVADAIQHELNMLFMPRRVKIATALAVEVGPSVHLNAKDEPRDADADGHADALGVPETMPGEEDDFK